MSMKGLGFRLGSGLGLGCGWVLGWVRVETRHAVPPLLAGLALTQLLDVGKGAGGAHDRGSAAVRAGVAQWARHARCPPCRLLVEAARAVAALCLVVEVGVRARGAELAHAVGTGTPSEADAAQRSHLVRVRIRARARDRVIVRGLGLGLGLGHRTSVLSWQPAALSHE